MEDLTVGVYTEIHRVLSSPTRARAASAPARSRWSTWQARDDGALTVLREGAVAAKFIAPTIMWAFLVLAAAVASRKTLARATTSAPSVLCAVLDVWGIYAATSPGPAPFGAVCATFVRHTLLTLRQPYLAALSPVWEAMLAGGAGRFLAFLPLAVPLLAHVPNQVSLAFASPSNVIILPADQRLFDILAAYVRLECARYTTVTTKIIGTFIVLRYRCVHYRLAVGSASLTAAARATAAAKAVKDAGRADRSGSGCQRGFNVVFMPGAPFAVVEVKGCSHTGHGPEAGLPLPPAVYRLFADTITHGRTTATLSDLQECVEIFLEQQRRFDEDMLECGGVGSTSGLIRTWRYQPGALPAVPAPASTAAAVGSGEARRVRGCLCGRARDAVGRVVDCTVAGCPIGFLHAECMGRADAEALSRLDESDAEDALTAVTELRQLLSGGDDDAVAVLAIVSKTLAASTFSCAQCCAAAEREDLGSQVEIEGPGAAAGTEDGAVKLDASAAAMRARFCGGAPLGLTAFATRVTLTTLNVMAQRARRHERGGRTLARDALARFRALQATLAAQPGTGNVFVIHDVVEGASGEALSYAVSWRTAAMANAAGSLLRPTYFSLVDGKAGTVTSGAQLYVTMGVAAEVAGRGFPLAFHLLLIQPEHHLLTTRYLGYVLQFCAVSCGLPWPRLYMSDKHVPTLNAGLAIVKGRLADAQADILSALEPLEKEAAACTESEAVCAAALISTLPRLVRATSSASASAAAPSSGGGPLAFLGLWKPHAEAAGSAATEGASSAHAGGGSAAAAASASGAHAGGGSAAAASSASGPHAGGGSAAAAASASGAHAGGGSAAAAASANSGGGSSSSSGSAVAAAAAAGMSQLTMQPPGTLAATFEEVATAELRAAAAEATYPPSLQVVAEWVGPTIAGAYPLLRRGIAKHIVTCVSISLAVLCAAVSAGEWSEAAAQCLWARDMLAPECHLATLLDEFVLVFFLLCTFHVNAALEKNAKLSHRVPRQHVQAVYSGAIAVIAGRLSFDEYKAQIGELFGDLRGPRGEPYDWLEYFTSQWMSRDSFALCSLSLRARLAHLLIHTNNKCEVRARGYVVGRSDGGA